MSRTACAEPQCLYKGALYLLFTKEYFPISVNSYQATLRNIPEDRRSHIHRGGSLKSRKLRNSSGLSSASSEGIFENPLSWLLRFKTHSLTHSPVNSDVRTLCSHFGPFNNIFNLYATAGAIISFRQCCHASGCRKNEALTVTDYSPGLPVTLLRVGREEMGIEMLWA